MVVKTKKNRTSESNSSGATFQLKASGKQFMFNLKAANGEIILTSEHYIAKGSAITGIDSVRANSLLNERYARRKATSGDPYFVLKAANGEIIGTSETYSSNAALEKGISSVKENGVSANVDDHA